MRFHKRVLLWALPLTALLLGQPLFAEKLAVYHTSDIHGYYFSRADKSGQPTGGFAVLENVLLKETEPFVLLDSGDFSSGNKEANASDGRYSIELMNAAGKTPKNVRGQGYAALTIGNHDSDFGAETLGQMLGGFNGEVISVNVEGLQIPGKEISPYKIFVDYKEITSLRYTNKCILFLQYCQVFFFIIINFVKFLKYNFASINNTIYEN